MQTLTWLELLIALKTNFWIMMKGAVENVEVLHFFFISVLWGDHVLPLITSPPPLLSSPPIRLQSRYKWQGGYFESGGRRWGGKRTTPIKCIRLINCCRITVHHCEQVHCRPTRFSLSFASYAMRYASNTTPCSPQPIRVEEGGRAEPAGMIRGK